MGVRVSLQDPHESKAAMCACLQAMALHFNRKTFCPLAPPNHALAHACKASPQSSSASSFGKRHSSSPSSHTKGMILFWPGLLLLQSICHPLAHMNGDLFCASNHRANGACQQGPGFLHTNRVYDPSQQSPESAWSMCPPLLQLTSKMEKSSTIKYDHDTSAAISRHLTYMQVVSALRYVTASSPISI